MPNDSTPEATTAASDELPLGSPIDWVAVREEQRRRRKRRRLIGGVAAFATAATLLISIGLAADDEEKAPPKHTATMPTSFGDYRLAGEGESLWPSGSDDIDTSTGSARATYIRVDGKKSYIVTLDLDPVIDISDPGEDDAAVSVIIGLPVKSGKAKKYDAGPIGGKLRCVKYEVAETTSSRCVWGNDAATVTAQPVVSSGPRPTPDQTAEDTRVFLAALHIRAVN